jgi:copper resistance protein B
MKRLLFLVLVIAPLPAMAMDDTAWFRSTMIDVDSGRADGQATMSWDAKLRIGGDYDKLAVRARGDRQGSVTGHNELQLLWSHYLSHFWDVRAGYRHDFRPFARNEAVLAITGLAPYYVETNVALYVGRHGQLRGEIELAENLQLTQHVVAELYLDSEWNGFNDGSRQTGIGVSQVNAGTRLRYEFNRHVALYADFFVDQATGNTRTLLRAAGERTRQAGVRAGIRLFNL